MKNILTQLFILLAFFIGSISVGSAHFIDFNGGTQDMVVIQGKKGILIPIQIPSHYFTKDGLLITSLTFKVIHNGSVLYETTTLDKNIAIPYLGSLNGQISLELQILDHQDEIKLSSSLF